MQESGTVPERALLPTKLVHMAYHLDCREHTAIVAIYISKGQGEAPSRVEIQFQREASAQQPVDILSEL